MLNICFLTNGRYKSKLFDGFRGKTLKWIDSFPCYRTQRAVVNEEISQWAPVLSGVPQGTIHSSLMFTLYINDISKMRLTFCSVCYRDIRDAEDPLKLQNDRNSLRCLARRWGMIFQPVKYSIMQITRKTKIKLRFFILIGKSPQKCEFHKYSDNHIHNEMKYTN